MKREDAETLLSRAHTFEGAPMVMIHSDDLRELCTVYLANMPKARPEEVPGVPVRIEEADILVLPKSGVYLYGRTGDHQWGWTEARTVNDTHVVYIEVPR